MFIDMMRAVLTSAVLATASVCFGQVTVQGGSIEGSVEVRLCSAPGTCETRSEPIRNISSNPTYETSGEAAIFRSHELNGSSYGYGQFRTDWPGWPNYEPITISFVGGYSMSLSAGSLSNGSSASCVIVGEHHFGVTRRMEYLAFGYQDTVVMLDGAPITGSGVLDVGWHTIKVRLDSTIHDREYDNGGVHFYLDLYKPDRVYEGRGGEVSGNLLARGCMPGGDPCDEHPNTITPTAQNGRWVADGGGQTGGGYGGVVSSSVSASGRIDASVPGSENLEMHGSVEAEVRIGSTPGGTGVASLQNGRIGLRIYAFEPLRFERLGTLALFVDGAPYDIGGVMRVGEHLIEARLPDMVVREGEPRVRVNYWADLTLAPHCPGDLTGFQIDGVPDGGVTIDDLVFFLEQFAAGDSRADVDDGTWRGVQDGGVTIDDLIFYLDRFRLGC